MNVATVHRMGKIPVDYILKLSSKHKISSKLKKLSIYNVQKCTF